MSLPDVGLTLKCMAKKSVFRSVYLAIFILVAITCSPKPYFFRANYKTTNSLLHETENLREQYFLKAHLKNGDVYILKDSWEIDSLENLVTGVGESFDFNRNKTSEGLLSIAIDSVAIFETNKNLGKTESKRIRALAILAGVDVAIGTFCLTNPKACFGSCPTFYIHEEDDFHYATAEGFSNAIAPSMEYADIDALNNEVITGGTFSLTVRNEALETHVIRNLRLLAFPRQEEQRVYQSPGDDFFLCKNIHQLTSARGREGDATAFLKFPDRKERFSLADSLNLNSREEIYLSFEDVSDPSGLGLLINFRQTLMTTYFIYSAMGYMGDEVGDIFAKLETSEETQQKLEKGIKKQLGKIEIYSWDVGSASWVAQGGFYETGPVAYNRQLLPLNISASTSGVKIKVVLNRGLWRIDDFALTNIVEKVQPEVLAVEEILTRGLKDPEALEAINSAEDYLVSMPGNEYKIRFQLPATHQDYELFLYSKGYYLEWMRENWIKDKNLPKLRQMIEAPETYLKQEAKAYKVYERTMEQQFWNSKINSKTFEHYGT